MNPSEVLRIVDAIHRDKNIEQEIVFQAIEAALVSAAKKNYGEDSEIEIAIHRQDGSIEGTCNGEFLDPEETVGRIGAQTAKQVIIQKIREAERDALYEEYKELMGEMVGGAIQRGDSGATTVSLGNVEAILPRGEQIPGESHHPNERIRATVFDVRKQGSRVKVILSRTRPQLVQRLFEQEIPEIVEGVIAVRAMAREPGYRSKVAVSSSDQRVDCVGACVGVRGNRIKNIVDELSGERIDIVRWNDDMQVLIPNALQPAEVDEVILCKMMGRAIVLVREDQLSLAIGRRGQNVRLASKLCGWDIEIMTREELEEQIDRAVTGFSELEGVTDVIAEKLVGEGFLSYDDLSVIEPDDLLEMAEGELTQEQLDAVVAEAEKRAEEAEQAAAVERRRQREKERIDKATAEAEALERQAAGTDGLAEQASAPEDTNDSATQQVPTESIEAGTDVPADGNAPASEETAAEVTEETPTIEPGENDADVTAEAPAIEPGETDTDVTEETPAVESEETDTEIDDDEAAPESEESAPTQEHPDRKEDPREVAD